MATLTTALVRQAFATALADMYTVPTGSTAILTNIVVVNTAASPEKFNISLDSVELFSDVSVNGNSTVSIDLKQVLNNDTPAKKITGFATSTSVKVHISGVEIGQ
jgi:hypothetical protein